MGAYAEQEEKYSERFDPVRVNGNGKVGPGHDHLSDEACLGSGYADLTLSTFMRSGRGYDND